MMDVEIIASCLHTTDSSILMQANPDKVEGRH